jgi:hypothetical protein
MPKNWPNDPHQFVGKRVVSPKHLHGVLDADAAANEAYQFPEATSFRISFSSVRSDTALRKCAFSLK